MRIELYQPAEIDGLLRTPDDGPIAVDDATGVDLVMAGNAKSLDGPVAHRMMRAANTAKKAPGAAAAPTARSSAALWVVIPTCGRPPELDRTLTAIFSDPPEQVNVVVVNDAPDDQAREEVREVVDRHNRASAGRVHYVETDGGQGVVAARIAGVDVVNKTYARGALPCEATIIVEVDDHDTPQPGALRRIAHAFGDPAVRAVYGDLYKVDAQGRVVAHVKKLDYRPGLFLAAGNQAWGIRAYRLSLYQAVGGREPDWTYASEYALFLRFEQHLCQSNGASHDAAIRRLARPLCRWPIAPSGISIRYKAEQTEAAERYAYLSRAGALLPSRGGALARATGEARRPCAAPVTVSVVVPCYKSQSYAQALADSLASDEFKGTREIVWVLDGDKPDTYPEFPADHQVIVRDQRGGFAAAVNTGAQNANGAYVCLLNADTVVSPGWLDKLVERLEGRPEAAACGPTILNVDGSVNSLGSEFDWRLGSFPHVTADSAARERDAITGACLLARRALWEALGGLDEAYRLGYWEDTDLCMRIRRAGYEIVVAPDAKIVHHEGHTGLGWDNPFYEANRRRFHGRWVETGLVDKFARQRGLRPHAGPSSRASENQVCVCVIALNESEYIAACIESVYALADRILVVEGGNEFSAAVGMCRADGTSIDGTMDVVASVRDPRGIIETYRPPKARPWRDKTEARQFCLDRLKPGDWCIALDADEVLWEEGLWRLSALMHESDYVGFGLETFWRDFDTVGRDRWQDYFFNMRCFRVRQGYGYATHLRVVNRDGAPIDTDPSVRKRHEPTPLAAHFSWVKPERKIRDKLDYYRRQCPGKVLLDDYLERVFLADLDEANRIGTHPMGGGTCEPWQGRLPEPVERRMKAGLFGWLNM